YISNYSWLQGLSHPVMRERLARTFDCIWIDNCNGDKYKTGKRTPDGRPDESMFTTDDHRVGIQVGTAVASLVKRGKKDNGTIAEVYYRDLWGTGNEKRSVLLKSLGDKSRGIPKYHGVVPRESVRWVFASVTSKQQSSFESWPKLADLFPVHYSGLNENR